MNEVLSVKYIIRAIHEFDKGTDECDQESTTIQLPQGFQRFRHVAEPLRPFNDPVQVAIEYRHKHLAFEVRLADASVVLPTVAIRAGTITSAVGETLDAYQLSPRPELTLSDAKTLIAFLTRYSCGFDFTIITPVASGRCDPLSSA